jgi:hypothetical protein
MGQPAALSTSTHWRADRSAGIRPKNDALVLKIIGRAKRFRLLNTRHRETVLVNSPMAMLNDITLSIRTVTFTQDSGGGTLTTLDLVDPRAGPG